MTEGTWTEAWEAMRATGHGPEQAWWKDYLYVAADDQWYHIVTKSTGDRHVQQDFVPCDGPPELVGAKMAKEPRHEVLVSFDNTDQVYLYCDDCDWRVWPDLPWPYDLSLTVLTKLSGVSWTDYNEELYFYHD